MARFDAIVFDFDGVLVESVDLKTWAFAELYQPYGEGLVAQVVDYHLAHGGVSRYEKFRYFHRELLGVELLPEAEALLGDRFSQLVEDAVVASPWVPGAHDFLEAHHKVMPLYVASGTPDEELKRIVAQRQMAFFFRATFGTPARKGEILRRIVAEGGFAPSRVLMIGDAMTDFDGAQEAGTAFLGRVTKGASSPFPAAVQTIEDLGQLAACLRG